MVIPTAYAYVGKLAPHGYEGRYMGLFNIAMIAGFGIGPLLGGVVHDSLGMDATFISMAMLSTFGFLIVLLFLPTETSSHGVKESEEPSSSLASMLRDETMRGIITIQLVYGLLFGTVLAFVGVWMTTVLETSVAQVGVVLSARVIINGTFTYPFGWLADRTNRIILASAGMVMVAMGTFAIPWLGSFALLLGLFMIIGIFESLALPSVNAMTVEKGRGMGMGSVMGVFNMASALGLAGGSMAGGVIENSVGIVEVFRYTAVLGFVGVVVFNIFMWRNARLAKQHRVAQMVDMQD
jgi:predicted MFS family arabinose efflux permease